MSKNGSSYHRLLTAPRWRTLRASVLSASPFCADCAREGVLTAATDVHHIVPINESDDPESMAALAYDRNNLVGLCRACHIQRHVKLKSHTGAKRAERERKAGASFWERLDKARATGGVFFEAPPPSSYPAPRRFSHAGEKSGKNGCQP